METMEITKTTEQIDGNFALLKSNVDNLQIQSSDDLLKAGDLLKTIKEFIKSVETKRTEFVKPLNDTVTKINAVFKPKSTQAESIRRTLEGKMSDYHIEQERLRKEEEEKRRAEERARKEKEQKALEEAAQRLKSETLLNQAIKVEEEKNKIDEKPIEVRQTTMKSGNTTTSFKKVWDFEILDHSSVPIAYYSVDPEKIKIAIKSGTREIPGIKIFEKSVIASR